MTRTLGAEIDEYLLGSVEIVLRLFEEGPFVVQYRASFGIHQASSLKQLSHACNVVVSLLVQCIATPVLGIVVLRASERKRTTIGPITNVQERRHVRKRSSIVHRAVRPCAELQHARYHLVPAVNRPLQSRDTNASSATRSVSAAHSESTFVVESGMNARVSS